MMTKKPIYCFVKSGLCPSSAVASIVEKVIEYNNEQDFVSIIKAIIEEC